MKEYKQYLFVDKPGVISSWLLMDETQDRLQIDWEHGGTWNTETIQLPPGTYSIVGLANDFREINWDDIVEKVKLPLLVLFKNYTPENGKEYCATRKESGYSLLHHLGLSKQVLIIKKEGK